MQSQSKSTNSNPTSNAYSTTLNCSILSIGSELTTGQILNRNSHWLAEKIYAYGINPHLHLSVPDDRKLILQALDFCASSSDVIFVTGGLGPTSDDFTREVIAEWSQQPLKWNEAAWQHIHHRLTPRGIAVKEIQKQQCYFPEKAEILHNELGTAHGFFLITDFAKKSLDSNNSNISEKKIFVLPGPPKEIAGIWQPHIATKLENWTTHTDKMITHSWDTIGVGESEIAEAVESSLAGKKQNPEDFEIGYRVHLPFVEVKLSYKKSFSSQAELWRDAVEKAIGNNTVLRDGADAAGELTTLISKLIWQNQNPSVEFGLEIVDTTQGSFLLHRMYPHLHQQLTTKQNTQSPIKWKFSSDHPNPEFKSDPRSSAAHGNSCATAISLQLIAQQNGVATAKLTYQNQTRKIDISAPYRSSLLKEREAQYWAEMAMIFWLQQLYDLCYTGGDYTGPL